MYFRPLDANSWGVPGNMKIKLHTHIYIYSKTSYLTVTAKTKGSIAYLEGNYETECVTKHIMIFTVRGHPHIMSH